MIEPFGPSYAPVVTVADMLSFVTVRQLTKPYKQQLLDPYLIKQQGQLEQLVLHYSKQYMIASVRRLFTYRLLQVIRHTI
jgi:hypothetical protein